MALRKKRAQLPVLSLPQAQVLVVDSLRHHHLPFLTAVDLVNYHMRRNKIAYDSHRKTTLASTGIVSCRSA